MKIPTKPPHKFRQQFREIDQTCPCCLSVLILSEKGNFSCTGNKLKLWEPQFEAYSKLNEIEQNNYLQTIEDIEQFLDLYNRWNYVDRFGNRTNFVCDFTISFNSNLTTNILIIADPLTIKHIERKMGRKLTEEEIRGEKKLWVENDEYYNSYKKGRKRVDINTIAIPDEV